MGFWAWFTGKSVEDELNGVAPPEPAPEVSNEEPETVGNTPLGDAGMRWKFGFDFACPKTVSRMRFDEQFRYALESVNAEDDELDPDGVAWNLREHRIAEILRREWFIDPEKAKQLALILVQNGVFV